MIPFPQISAVALCFALFKKDDKILDKANGIWPTMRPVSLDVLQAISWMGTPWSTVENDTIIKCFVAGGISGTFSEAATVSIVIGFSLKIFFF